MKLSHQHFNLSSFLLGVLVVLGLGLIINATPHDPTHGRYQTVTDEHTIVVTDTKTGDIIIRYAARNEWKKVSFKEEMSKP